MRSLNNITPEQGHRTIELSSEVSVMDGGQLIEPLPALGLMVIFTALGFRRFGGREKEVAEAKSR